ncbi:MAG: hypothetical protein ABF250_05560 [Polaribacter sp.]|uniref:hypothetical protein n=1 Tax=Polaribacter sp. TaxID=1920175 RepID=UPI00321B1D7B
MKNLFNRYCSTSQFKLFSIILFLFMFSGCLSIKPSATKSGKNYFETFYAGKEGTQYFIKPIIFKDEKSNEDLILDITFRYRNEIKDSAIVNISIKSSIVYKTIDSLKLSNKDIEIKSDKVELLFNEKNKTGFTSRYSTMFSLKEIKEMFNNDEWKIIIYKQNKTTTYKPHRKTIRAINTVRDKVFILMSN